MAIEKSILDKLKNKAKQSGKPFQLYLQLFCQEEFLRRLSKSIYIDNLILKGGLFIYTLTKFESRATIDVDFLLCKMSNEIKDLQYAIEEIIYVNTGNNYIKFEALGYEEISPQRKYKGISFQLIGTIGNTKTPFNVDIGVGDIISPKPQILDIPTQLDGFETPTVKAYSVESTIAEKIEAILQRMELSSRMKDFYDIYYLANQFSFDSTKLQNAVVKTLENRKTKYSLESMESVRKLSDNMQLQKLWKEFLKRTKLVKVDFNTALDVIYKLLNPIIVAKNDLSSKWNNRNCMWRKR
ncbi:MAG: nucleotidyl transferase AbiEii/AbiGii toxin family protein [Endomicrobium sp.]|jgi:predicted nucleotidyltransferase component of viral defense system|nr:nucleotidyl transferase AbiEii/AbiGii toxin family protein [Endomicrobium sp.]